MLVILLGLVLLASVMTIVLRIGPHYIDWRTMQSIFDGLPANEINTMTKSDIRNMLAKRFRINSLRDFDLKEVVDIERAKSGTQLIVAYERREHIIGNVDVILSFSERYQYN